MTVHASPLHADTSLAALLELLAPHEEKALVFDYGGRRVQPGYHVTEVKAGSFVTLACGGNPDAWQETILQVEDIPAREGQSFLRAGKFRAILAQVDRKVVIVKRDTFPIRDDTRTHRRVEHLAELAERPPQRRLGVIGKVPEKFA